MAKSPQALRSSLAAKLMTVVDSRFENLLVRFGIPECQLKASLSQDMLRVYKCASEEHRGLTTVTEFVMRTFKAHHNLGGMMDEPGWSVGKRVSCRPACEPECIRSVLSAI